MARSRGRRRTRTQKTTSLHWLNLAMYVVALLIVLLGLRTLGDGTASCVMKAAQTPDGQASPADEPETAEPAPEPDHGN